MAHSYASQYPPNVKVDSGIKAFFEAFYRAADDPVDHEKFAGYFADDAVVVMGAKKVSGRAGMSYSF
jgi:hypothetical protein